MTHRLFSSIGGGKFLLLWGLSLLFGLSGRAGTSGSLPLHLLSVLNDQYYFIFAVLPVFLFFCAGVMEDDAPLVVMRYQTYGRYFFHKWRVLTLISAVLWLGQMAVLLLSCLGLAVDGSWLGAAEGLWGEVFTLLQRHFSAPWLAVLCCALQLLLGYWLVSLAALWLGHFCSRSLAVKLLMTLYLFSVLWIKLPILSRPPFVFLTGLNHWVLLLHNLTEPWRMPLTAAVTAILTAGMVWSVSQKWRWQLHFSRHGGKGLTSYYRRVLFTRKNGLLLTGLILLAAAWAWLGGGTPEDGTAWLVRLLAGHGTGYFYPMGLLLLLMIEVLPLWPLGVFCTQVISERSVFLTVRLRRRKELMGAILHTSLLWMLLYGGLLTLAAVLPPLALDLPLDMSLVTAAVGLKLLDVAVQALLILSALCLTGQAAVGFVAVVLLQFLCVLPIPWLPVGLSSLARLDLPQTGGTVPVLPAAALLAALSLALILWLYKQGVKRLFNH